MRSYNLTRRFTRGEAGLNWVGRLMARQLAALALLSFGLSAPMMGQTWAQAPSVVGEPQEPLSIGMGYEDSPRQRGTPFRGIAIGDDRQHVEQTLAGLGLRCMSQAEKDRLAEGGFPVLETLATLDLCRIVKASFTLDNELQANTYIDQTMLEFRDGNIYYGVFFENGAASRIHLQPSFFSAEQLDGWSFARSIADNYLTPESLTPTANGVGGRTPSGDVVRVVISPSGTLAIVTIEAPTTDNVPSFD